jgi:PadR family transcriptional regulator PadR
MGRPRITTQTLVVLSVLLRDPMAEWYGFELADHAKLKSGTLYPLLARLERAGWLESRWEDVDPHQAGRPRRRLYLLTGEGANCAREVLDEHMATLSPSLPPRARPGLATVGRFA